MGILELFASGSGLLFLVLSMVEIAPIKVNPWSAIARALGSVINRDVIARLDDISRVQKDTQRRLDDHIKLDDERDADMHRAKICGSTMSCCGTSRTRARNLSKFSPR